MVDLREVEALIRQTSEREVLPRFRRLARHEIEEKSGPGDLVTAADLAAERFLSTRLAALLPRSSVVGEEAVARDRRLLDRLGEPGWVWIIDPVDGTYNFAHGREGFAIIVALVADGELVAGWIHDPIRGDTVVAERGAGAFLGERRLAVAAARPVGEMRAALYVGRRREPELYERIRALKASLGPRSFARSAAMEYFALVEGRLHYAIFTRQLPWDHAAGWLIHHEAGGHGAYLDGTQYRPVEESKALLLAPDQDTWHSLRRLLLGS